MTPPEGANTQPYCIIKSMKIALKHPRESERLAALNRLNILDTLPEDDYDNITLIASQICETPIALVSLIDDSRQWFKSKKGLDINETPRDIAFCAHAILENTSMVVPDARLDDRFKNNPIVTGEPAITFYAGAQLMSPDGFPIGTLCVVDFKPRQLSAEQIGALNALAKQIGRLLQLRDELEKEKLYVAELEIKRTVIENLHEGVVVQDNQSNILFCNPSAARFLGGTPESLIGKKIFETSRTFIKADGSPIVPAAIPSRMTVATAKSQRDLVLGMKIENAPTRWLRANSSPIFGSEGSGPTHVVTSFTDITVEKETLTELELNEAHLARVLDGVPAMIGHWDSNLKNLHANKAYTEYFGKPPSQIKGLTIKEVIGQELYELNRPYIEKALAGQPQSFDRQVVLPNGSVRETLASYLPEFINGKVVGFFAVTTDITKIKNLEREREVLIAHMVETSKLSTLGEMAGGVAHEINTPLAVILSKSEMIVEMLKDGTFEKESAIVEIEKISATAERIAKIVKGLRQFSRHSDHDPKENIEVRDIVDSTLELCRAKLVMSGIELRQNIEVGLSVAGRSAELSQVVMNLINNAMDAVEVLPEKYILVSAKKQGPNVELSVTDSGHGINPAIAEKIMNPFFTTKEIGRGTGLGLSISKGIIEAHGGRFYYDEKNANTRFVIELPAL